MSNSHKHLSSNHSHNNHNSHNSHNKRTPKLVRLPLPQRVHPTRLRRSKTNSSRKRRRCQANHQLERQRAEPCGRCSPASQLHEVDEVVGVAVLTSRIHLASSNRHKPRHPSNNSSRSVVLDFHEAAVGVEGSRAEVDTRMLKLRTKRKDKRDKRARGGAD